MTKETAEQKLLKALQKKSGIPVAISTKNVPANKNSKFSLSIFDLNKILFLGVVISFAILVFQLNLGRSSLSKNKNFLDETKNVSHQEETVVPQLKNVKFYIDSFGNRNIFKPYDISLGKATQAQPNLSKRLTKYKLVGVSWLDLPESVSVMIEDTKNKTTYFLKNGEQVEGVTVKTIYTDRVVFSYENEETTIKL